MRRPSAQALEHLRELVRAQQGMAVFARVVYGGGRGSSPARLAFCRGTLGAAAHSPVVCSVVFDVVFPQGRRVGKTPLAQLADLFHAHLPARNRKKGVMRRGVCGGRRPRGRQTGSCSSEFLPPRSEASLSFLPSPSWGPASLRERTSRNESQLIKVYVPSDPANTSRWSSPLRRRVGRTGHGHHCRPTAG